MSCLRVYFPAKWLYEQSLVSDAFPKSASLRPILELFSCDLRHLKFWSYSPGLQYIICSYMAPLRYIFRSYVPLPYNWRSTNNNRYYWSPVWHKRDLRLDTLPTWIPWNFRFEFDNMFASLVAIQFRVKQYYAVLLWPHFTVKAFDLTLYRSIDVFDVREFC